MSTLTEEQRRRMEENRLKALQRRALKSGMVLNGNNQTKTMPVAKPAPSIPNSTSNFVPSKPTVAQSTLQVSPSVSGNSTAPAVSATNNNNKPTFSPFKGREIRGECVLLSRKRFCVEIAYHKEVIEIFKSVPGRLYDMQTKKWNFSIDDHDKLINLLKPLQPGVLVVPLPRHVVKIFKETGETKVIKEYDLSHMDQTLVSALLPFQKIGVYFGIQHGGRILLADDMGLGKTIQGIAIANYFINDWPLLVVTPSSVRYSWLEAFQTWLPSVGAHEISVINTSKDHIPNNKVIVMSYDLLTKLQNNIISRKFKSVIFDESHFLKSHKAARTKAAQAVMKNIKRVIMLSGTPALSRPIELFTQISALVPQYFKNANEYGIRYCNGKSMPWGMDFSGSSNMAELKLILEELVMLRRLKSDVIKELPSKIRQMIVLDPSKISTKSKVLRSLSQRLSQGGFSSAMERRGCLLQYYHETGSVKVPAVCEYILDLLECDKKFLCFAHHQTIIKSICACIERKKIDFICIDGSVTAEQRKHLCDRFQKSDACKVAVLSITAANCGITLTAASLVIFAELFWNPGILTQAEDRAHRIGQEDSVVVQYLVAKNTADDEMWPLVQRKLDILNKAGLSKDNFRSAYTILKENPQQSTLDEIWSDLDSSEISDFDSAMTPDFDSSMTPDLEDLLPEKRARIEE